MRYSLRSRKMVNMESQPDDPPRPPLEPVDHEEAGCVSGMIVLVALLVTAAMLFIWFMRKVW